MQPAEQLLQLGVDAVHAHLEAGELAQLADLALDLRPHLGDDLLDPRRVDAAVGDEPLERQPRDLAPHLAGSGFVLSTSRRESFGMGLVEGAASGAVPVVRDWPIFASLDGARGLFPEWWVAGTVEQAVARIRSLADEPTWSEASEEARRVVQERFSSDTTRATFQELVLGG